jgi:hypothetical protein
LLGHAELSTTQIHTQVSIRKLKEIHSANAPGEFGAQLAEFGTNRQFGPMSRVIEIEAAIEKLAPAELRELMGWLEMYKGLVLCLRQTPKALGDR